MEFDAETIRAMRAKVGMTQAAFAEFVGVGTATVGRWESGEFAPSPMAIPRLEQAAKEIEARGRTST